MGLGETLMKRVEKVGDAGAAARRIRESPTLAMNELVRHVRNVFAETLEHVMHAATELHLAESGDPDNKRNGYRQRAFEVKGLGTVTVRVPRERTGTFESRVVPASRCLRRGRRADLAIQRLAGTSIRMVSISSKRVLGVRVSAREVSKARVESRGL